MNVLIGATNIVSDYSQTAHRIWRQINGWGLAFDFKQAPRDGLIEKLGQLRDENKITDFRYLTPQPENPYHYVYFEIPIPTEDLPLAENGESAVLMEVAAIVNQFFEDPEDQSTRV